MKLATCGNRLMDWNTKEVVVELPPPDTLIHLMAFGTRDAKKLARYVSQKVDPRKTYFMCSSNEACLLEMRRLCPTVQVGLSDTFPCARAFRYDFVHIDRSMDCPEVRKAFRDKKII